MRAKIKKLDCNICFSKDELPMLKKLRGVEAWVHVPCALFSDEVSVVDYHKMEFEINKNIRQSRE